ncbi:ATP-binding protein [Salinarimonas sp.]|uniref:ATP-binding protein n=1 Tax=Salinarimonas sp. TaxID=2766526 RepID=UPI0032D92524
MPRPTAYAMCGLAFSGKSTVARRLAAALDLALISLDAINDERGFDGGGVIDDSEWERTSHLAMDRLARALAAGRSALVDDTFAMRFLRDRARRVAEAHDARFVLIHVETPIETIQARRRRNDETRARMAITDAVFDDHVARFEPPGPDEPVLRIASEADLAALIAAERAAR